MISFSRIAAEKRGRSRNIKDFPVSIDGQDTEVKSRKRVIKALGFMMFSLPIKGFGKADRQELASDLQIIKQIVSLSGRVQAKSQPPEQARLLRQGNEQIQIPSSPDTHRAGESNGFQVPASSRDTNAS